MLKRLLAASLCAAVLMAAPGCATDPNRPPPLQLTDDNRYKQNCNPLGGRFSVTRCAKAQEEQRRIEERKRQAAIQAEQRRIAQEQRAAEQARKQAELDRTKDNPLNGAEIGQLQTALQTLGYTAVTPTGVVDGATREAILAYQNDRQLTAHGRATQEVLRSATERVRIVEVGRRNQAIFNQALGALLGVGGGGGESCYDRCMRWKRNQSTHPHFECTRECG